jgi:Holliday junction DNA helicase RuvB
LGGIYRLEFYTYDVIGEIIKRLVKKFGVKTSRDVAQEIAKLSRFTPRTTNYLLRCSRDFARVYKKEFSKDMFNESLKLLGIDEMGLTLSDRNILGTIINKFNGGPARLKTSPPLFLKK